MCGIAGIAASNSIRSSLLEQMIQCLHHRGPDHIGLWISDNHNVGLCHARLSVQDLSSNGNQPMVSKSGRFILVFNGEIYNHSDLRTALRASHDTTWTGSSDTETLLTLIELYGLSRSLELIKGMFAFALFDQQINQIYLVRDRFGEKPLYYGKVNSDWVFASELSPFSKVPGFSGEIDRYALQIYLQYNSIPAPHSIFKDVWKVEPGQIVTLSIGNGPIEKRYYWKYDQLTPNSSKDRHIAPLDDLLVQLDGHLTNAVSSQLIGDVPIGAFLSGGIDSSLVTAIAQRNSDHTLKTFSIGFEVSEYDEAKHAARVAKHLGTDHNEMYVSSHDALNVIPKLSQIYDEPFADSSQIPSYLLSKAAREQVTVCLTGDGADELFGGYNRYLVAQNIWGKLSSIPHPARQALALLINTIKPATYSKFCNTIMGPRYGDIGDKIHKTIPMIKAKNIDDLYRYFVSQIPDSETWLLNANALPDSNFTLQSNPISPELSPVELMMLKDISGYLPTDILAKVDRAAMAVSLETRTPFLDLDVVNFAAKLSLSHKINGHQNKAILRQLLYQYVPQKLVDRPKMGFGVPLASWLRGPLRDWAENLLSEDKLKEGGYFNSVQISKKWQEHISGKQNWQHQLWNVIMFQSWLERLKSDTTPFILSLDKKNQSEA